MRNKDAFFILFPLCFFVILFSSSIKTKALVLPPDDILVEENISQLEFVAFKKNELPEFLINAEELRVHGLNDAIKLTPQGNRFEDPTQYFRISTDVTSSLDCMDCANLVSIYITPYITTGTPEWIKNQNPLQEEYFNRNRVKLFVAGRIVFITAPKDVQLDAFLRYLRERIILNKTS